MTMPLVLAIEPNPQQAAQLTSIARRLGVGLLLTESAGRALERLSDRLPDLILTPALLSHADDQALTTRLRELGDTAAHIQTLTVPLFAVPEPPARGRRMLSVLRRVTSTVATPAGCDAETFAEQLALYLERAAKARRPSEGQAASDVCIDVGQLTLDDDSEILGPTPAPVPANGSQEHTLETDRAGRLDDWSYFDPEQCRFAALLAKLDEIADPTT